MSLTKHFDIFISAKLSEKKNVDMVVYDVTG